MTSDTEHKTENWQHMNRTDSIPHQYIAVLTTHENVEA